MKLTQVCGVVLGLAASTITAQDSTSKPTLRLELGQIKHVTDDLGNILVQNILPLSPGELIKIKLLDGTELIGCVGLREESYKAYIKVQGVVLNTDDECEFGLIAVYEGELRGVVAFKNSGKIFTVRYSEIQKSFVFDLQPPKPKVRA